MKKWFLFYLIFPSIFQAAENSTEIILWHALDDYPAEIFQKIVEDFNYQSNVYRIIPKRKGNYKDIYEMGLSAYLEGKPPHILHICEIANSKATQTPGFFKPVEDLMKHFQKNVDPAAYIDAIRNFFTDQNGKMLSLPWNISMGVLAYNKSAFTKAGLDPNTPPKTWEELEVCLHKLEANSAGGFAAAWPAAYHLEHVCCWHHFPLIARDLEKLSTRLIFHQPSQTHHLDKLVEWHKKGFFHYAGCLNEETEELFLSGKCAILLQGINRMPSLLEKADFAIGMGSMPYWEKFPSDQRSSPVGGGSFWVFSGFSEREYRGISHFLYYLLSSEVQSYWHQKTGFLPITEAAYYLSRKKHFYADYPMLEIPIQTLLKTPNSKVPIQHPIHYKRICDLIIDYLEKTFSTQTEAEELGDCLSEKSIQ